MARVGLNGNFHLSTDEHLLEGIKYLGDSEWVLPEGASVMATTGDDDWQITLSSGIVLIVWTEE